MMTQSDLWKFGLAALLTGLAIPLAVQLFLLLRTLHRIGATLDGRLDHLLRDTEELVSELRGARMSSPSGVAQLAAAVPAVIAAIQAFRLAMSRPEPATIPSPSDAETSTKVPR